MVAELDASAGTFPAKGVAVCCCALDEEGAWGLVVGLGFGWGGCRE